jgi:hypothetical protein
MLGILVDFGRSVVSELLASLLSHSIRMRFAKGIRFPFTISFHLAQLEAKVRDMPFIYRDLEGDVLNDFVELDMKRFDLTTFRTVTAPTHFSVDKMQRLRDYPKVLILGSAGVGKTTFQRHTILTVLGRRRRVGFLHAIERPIPFYVPLKAVDNLEQWPILRYILHTSGISIKRLTRLAARRKLFLFIDGYDEAPFANPEKGERDYVQEELDIMLGSPINARQVVAHFGGPPEVSSFYRALEDCRVWLSSRREFFEKHPLGLDGRPSYSTNTALKAVELIGVGNNRLRLVKMIFDKYKARSSTYHDLLHEEYFVQNIDDSNEHEVRELSYNPLFLTIMCYIYASRALALGTSAVSWTETLYQLILECVRLLLRDLDEAKARDLPKAHREALLRRRNAYTEEKTLFLPSFAFNLFLSEKGLFDIEYIKEQITRFFTAEDDSPKNQRIVAELAQTKASYPNMALQLIFSGIYVLVDRSRLGVMYDFPHRRFREVLACEHIVTAARFEQLLANLQRRSMAELVRVFLSSPPYRNLILHEKTLRLLLQGAKKTRGHYSINVTHNFMEIKPPNYDPSDVLCDFVREIMNEERVEFEVSDLALRSFNPSEAYVSWMGAVCRQALRERRPDRVGLCCVLLNSTNVPLLQEILRDGLDEATGSLPVLIVWLQYMCMCDRNALTRRMAEDPQKRSLVPFLAYVVAADKDAATCGVGALVAILSVLESHERVPVLAILWRYNRELYARLESPSYLMPADGFLASVFEVLESEERPTFPVELRECFGITAIALETMRTIGPPAYFVKREMDEEAGSKRRSGGTRASASGRPTRYYAVCDFEPLREEIIANLARLIGRVFVNEEDFEKELEFAVRMPMEEFENTLIFESSEEIDALVAERGGDEAQLTIDQFKRAINSQVRAQVRFAAQPYSEALDSLRDIAAACRQLSLPRFFFL